MFGIICWLRGVTTRLSLIGANAFVDAQQIQKNGPWLAHILIPFTWERIQLGGPSNCYTPKGFLKSDAELRVKDVNSFLVQKLKLKKKPISRKTQIATVWDQFFDQIEEADSSE